MNFLLLSLLLCWDPSPDPDLLGYWVETAERHIEEWVECPCPDIGVPCLITYCPVYNRFAWETRFTGIAPRFLRNDCAHESGSVCYYKHPFAEDWAGNYSGQPMLLWPPPIQGGCP